MRFRHPELLREAMTHASWNNEQGRASGPGYDNERLEYLGDAVLELVVGEYLFRRFPGYDEGQLTQLRAALVNTLSLARLAEKLELGDALLLGKGAAKTGANRLPSLLANAFEAMIGAIFLDQGYRVATRVFLQNIGDLADWSDQNHKGRLQEAAQERTGQPPTYRVQNVGGPGHRRLYSAEALVGGEVLGTGSGATKQAAEQAAARAALEALRDPRARRRVDPAGRAVAAARRAAGEAAGDTPRSRRRIAEAAVDRDAVAASAPPRRRSAPAPAPPLTAITEAVPAVASPARPAAAPIRRRGFLSALRSAAEVLVGRRADEAPPPAGLGRSAGPPPSAGRSATAPPAAREAPATAPGDHGVEDAEPARPRTRRGRRGGRGRNRSATPAGGTPPRAAAPARPAPGPRAGQQPRSRAGASPAGGTPSPAAQPATGREAAGPMQDGRSGKGEAKGAEPAAATRRRTRRRTTSQQRDAPA